MTEETHKAFRDAIRTPVSFMAKCRDCEAFLSLDSNCESCGGCDKCKDQDYACALLLLIDILSKTGWKPLEFALFLCPKCNK